MSSEPSFTIPVHPKRRFPTRGGVEYEGDTTFRLVPDEDHTESELKPLVVDVFEDGPYRWGDFIELPMALWLVRDDETADVFRVSIRDGAVRLHVLPATEQAGLERFYERLADRTEFGWSVECRTVEP